MLRKEYKEVLENNYVFHNKSLYQQLKESNIVCIQIEAFNRDYIKNIIDTYKGKSLLCIIEKELSYMLYDLMEQPNVSLILDTEIELQLESAIITMLTGTRFISKYFYSIMTIKYNCKSLTKREIYIIELLASGLTYQEIAEVAYLSVGTIRNNVSNILTELGFRNKTQLALHFQDLIKSPGD